MKKKSNSKFSFIIIIMNILLSFIILFFVYTKMKVQDTYLELIDSKLNKLEKKLDETLVPSTRIKKKKNKRKKTEWKK